MNLLLRRALVTVASSLLLISAANLTSPQPAAADVDVYITPGNHTVAGRQWRTTCEKYSSTVMRCRAGIKAHQVKLVNGRYANTFGWVFNNLTYKAAPRATWSNNNLGKTAAWTENGRRWYTQCDTATTGYNGCRSYIWATTVVARGGGFQQIQGWVFNNMVRFSNDFYGMYGGTGNGTVTLPRGATQLYVKGTQAVKNTGSFSVRGLDSTGGVTDVAFDTKLLGQQVGGAIGIVNATTVKLSVQATGAWSLSVHPFSTAPKLVSFKNDGTGSDVLSYDGPARTFTVTNTGSSRFVVRVWTGQKSTVVADTVGNFSGRTTLPQGNSFVQIETDGDWAVH